MKHWIMWSKHSVLVLIFRICLAVHHTFKQGQWSEWKMCCHFQLVYCGLQTNWNISYRAATGRSQCIWSYFYGCKEDSWSATNIIFTSAVPVVVLWIENIRMQLSHEDHSNGTLLNQKQELCTVEKVSCNPHLSLFPCSSHWSIS